MGLIWREISRKYTRKIMIKHAHAWNWDRKGGISLWISPISGN
jgi:hypothetical protein